MLRLTKAEAEQMFGKAEKAQKYRNKKCQWMGIQFDSIRERDRYIVLSDQEKQGIISHLRRQVRFELVPNQWHNGKLVERKVEYVADFVYMDRYGQTIVEDSKGFRKNQVWIIKRKLMLEKYGIRVQEV